MPEHLTKAKSIRKCCTSISGRAKSPQRIRLVREAEARRGTDVARGTAVVIVGNYEFRKSVVWNYVFRQKVAGERKVLQEAATIKSARRNFPQVAGIGNGRHQSRPQAYPHQSVLRLYAVHSESGFGAPRRSTWSSDAVRCGCVASRRVTTVSATRRDLFSHTLTGPELHFILWTFWGKFLPHFAIGCLIGGINWVKVWG